MQAARYGALRVGQQNRGLNIDVVCGWSQNTGSVSKKNSRQIEESRNSAFWDERKSAGRPMHFEVPDCAQRVMSYDTSAHRLREPLSEFPLPILEPTAAPGTSDDPSQQVVTTFRNHVCLAWSRKICTMPAELALFVQTLVEASRDVHEKGPSS